MIPFFVVLLLMGNIFTHDSLQIKKTKTISTVYKVVCSCDQPIWAAKLKGDKTLYFFGGSICCPFASEIRNIDAEMQFNTLKALKKVKRQ
jgi:hypothetical protein